ncbi:MAG: NrfD/PsrC family molybdoenzyme membrane anchor subunit [Syntrophobacteraceae bacterium]
MDLVLALPLSQLTDPLAQLSVASHFRFLGRFGVFYPQPFVLVYGSLPRPGRRAGSSERPEKKLYRLLSFGWRSTQTQWRPFESSYILFSAITVAFVPCVASIVSWDYALTIVPGYHSTIWGPYFMVGALHSGLAMLLTLIIPMRRIYRLEKIITVDVIENIAKILISTAFLMLYDYLVEFFMSWYGSDPTEMMTFKLRAVTGLYPPIFWFVVVSVIAVPFLFSFKSIRTNLSFLFIISIVMNIGMWLERFIIIIGPPAHDWIPYDWGWYWPSLVEWGILGGSISFFFLLFLVYSKTIPTISITETKEELTPPGASEGRAK